MGEVISGGGGGTLVENMADRKILKDLTTPSRPTRVSRWQIYRLIALASPLSSHTFTYTSTF